MKYKRVSLSIVLGICLSIGILAIALAAPGNPIEFPARNSNTAPYTTTISLTYDDPISPTTVTSQTFTVHAMQHGLVTATHSVSGSTILVTPTMPMFQNETVRIVATTGTLGIDGSAPFTPTQWMFRGGEIQDRFHAGFINARIELPQIVGAAFAWGDYDHDGDLDLLLSGFDFDLYSRITAIYRNDSDTFTDLGANIIGVQYAGMAWGDYDNDGDLDILLNGESEYLVYTSRIFRNDNGSFVDINANLTGLGRGSAQWGDYDNDGDLDALIAGFASNQNDGHTLLYQNNDGLFSPIDIGVPGVGDGSASWVDYDNDNDLDIYITGHSQSASGFESHSGVYENHNGLFTDIGDNIPMVHQGAVDWADYDNDGDLDIALSGYTAGFDGGRITRIYKNDGNGIFTHIDAGLRDSTMGSIAWGDYNNDGLMDLVVTGRESDGEWTRIYRNEGTSFTLMPIVLPKINESTASWGDYDLDGDLDLLLAGNDNGTSLTKIYTNIDDITYLPIVSASP